MEPRIHRTPILEKLQAPADHNRAAEYGSTAEAIDKVKGIFEEASSAPATPGPEGAVEAFVRLIETPADEQPFRTAPTAALEPLQPYNALAETMRTHSRRCIRCLNLPCRRSRPHGWVSKQWFLVRGSGPKVQQIAQLRPRDSSEAAAEEQRETQARRKQ